MRQLLLGMLAAFNSGRGKEFAAAFEDEFSFHPYTATVPGAGFDILSDVVRFVTDRHAAGDGWTAWRLVGAQSNVGTPSTAGYALDLLVRQGGARVAEGRGKVLVACDSGKLRTWVGPAQGPADAR